MSSISLNQNLQLPEQGEKSVINDSTIILIDPDTQQRKNRYVEGHEASNKPHPNMKKNLKLKSKSNRPHAS